MKNTIKKNGLFKDFTDRDIDNMLSETNIIKKKYNKNSYIFEQEDIPKYMFVLLSGRVQVEKTDINGKRTIVNIFKDGGTVFGEVYLYINQPYDYSCLAVEDSEILSIPKKYFLEDEKTQVQKKLTNNMLEVLSRKAFYLNQKLIILGSFTLRQKLSNYLLQMCEDSGKVKLQFNREELADYVGTTRPSLSRELMSMEADGLIQVEKNLILINDMERLKEIS